MDSWADALEVYINKSCFNKHIILHKIQLWHQISQKNLRVY